MMHHSESPREAMGLTTLRTRKPIRIGTWNVRTMYEGGRCANVAMEMKNYNLTILGLNETRWTGSGKTRLDSGETLVYSGHEEEDAPHTHGVGIMLSKEACRSLIAWQPVSARIVTALFKTTNARIMLRTIVAYAPTNDASDEAKEDFYETLQNTMNQTREREAVIVMGDFNAKVGSDNTGQEMIMGKHGTGRKNENGQAFIDFCIDNNLVIGGTVFPHKEVHKNTWVSPDKKTENQIDHICIRRLFRRSLTDVRVKRGADASSDHHLLVATFQLKLKKSSTRNSTHAKFDVRKLDDPDSKKAFQISLRNRFQTLENLETGLEEPDVMDTTWNKLQNVWIETCEESLGRKKHSNRPWITQDTLERMKERKEIKEKLINSRTRANKEQNTTQYKEKHAEIRRSARTDKRIYYEELAQRAEDAARGRNMRELYEITR